MSNISIDIDSARSILSTYQQIHDNPSATGPRPARSKLHKKNKELESELLQLKEKYTVLQKELKTREKRLENLNQELIAKANSMSKLQEDFENAIYQLTQKS